MEHLLLAEHILNLEKRLMNYKYKDFDELLADDFIEFSSSWSLYDKKAQIDTVKGINTNKTLKFTVTDFKIKLLTSDVLLATYQTYRHSDIKYALRSSILKKTRWIAIEIPSGNAYQITLYYISTGISMWSILLKLSGAYVQ